MPGIAQIRGMLLEEVLLFLLRISGYTTVTSAHAGTDPTLRRHAGGLAIPGRGCDHQIDAIADFTVVQPFGYPQRLLVEAKCYERDPVGIEVVRNALGVVRDVSEYWVSPTPTQNAFRRYHYQYVLFSLTAYSAPAQRFAFAKTFT